MSETKTVTAPKSRRHDKFRVGDLVTAAQGRLVYMIVPCDYSSPPRAGSGTLRGVVLHRVGAFDSDGDRLPCVGFLHDNLAESNLALYTRAVQVWN